VWNSFIRATNRPAAHELGEVHIEECHAVTRRAPWVQPFATQKRNFPKSPPFHAYKQWIQLLQTAILASKRLYLFVWIPL
jgi:hypothetical protein